MINKISIDISFENSLLFIISHPQSLIAVIVFCIDTSFKKDISKNKMLLSYLIISVLFSFYMILVDNSNLNNIFHIVAFDDKNSGFNLFF